MKWVTIESEKDLPKVEGKFVCENSFEDLFRWEYRPEPHYEDCWLHTVSRWLDESDVKQVIDEAYDIESAKKLRGYFGKNDLSGFEHWAYSYFDRIIKQYEPALPTSPNQDNPNTVTN